MKHRTITTLLAACLVPALGIGHCPPGDELAFGDSCLRINNAPARVVSFTSRAYGLNGSFELRLDVTACSTSLLRITNGAAEQFGPNGLHPSDAKVLHDALVEAGALDAESAPDDRACGVSVSAPFRAKEVIVYEPSPLPGTAWSNAFTFGTCAWSPETAAIEQLLTAWIDAHFDL